MLNKIKKQAGWSLIELTIILIVLSILCAILAPVIGVFVGNAKIVRCREDVQALGVAICMYIEDTGNSIFMVEGAPDDNDRPDQDEDNRIGILVSDGDIPVLGPDGQAFWTFEVGLTAPLRLNVDFMEYHLVMNRRPAFAGLPIYRTPGMMANDDPIEIFARDESGGFNSEFAWRGPYITAPIDPDPWGNRYAANVGFLDPRVDTENADPTDNGWMNDCVVISAGPDEEIDTVAVTDGLTPGDDDILYTVSGNSRP